MQFPKRGEQPLEHAVAGPAVEPADKGEFWRTVFRDMFHDCTPPDRYFITDKHLSINLSKILAWTAPSDPIQNEPPTRASFGCVDYKATIHTTFAF